MACNTIDLLRHGALDVPLGLYGKSDVPLSAFGRQQMRAAIHSYGPWKHIVCSPLQRCATFADQLAEQQGLIAGRDDALVELDFGQWDGLALDRFSEQQRDQWLGFLADPESSPPAPDGETWQAFCERVAQSWQRIQTLSQEGSVLVVTHGGVIRQIVRTLLEFPAKNMGKLEVAYGSLTRFRCCPLMDEERKDGEGTSDSVTYYTSLVFHSDRVDLPSADRDD